MNGKDEKHEKSENILDYRRAKIVDRRSDEGGGWQVLLFVMIVLAVCAYLVLRCLSDAMDIKAP